ncbi:MAG: hypothetical protein QQN41_07155 [Nitrosopumilus sp.]
MAIGGIFCDSLIHFKYFSDTEIEFRSGKDQTDDIRLIIDQNEIEVQIVDIAIKQQNKNQYISLNEGWMIKSILKKLEMHYTKPSNSFWLLIYSTDFPFTDELKEVEIISNYLKNNPHPFDMVWFLYPYAHSNVGHILKVWQSTA